MQKFNQLPKGLRDKVSTTPVMAAINELEKKYGLNLAATVMKVMVREIKQSDLADYFTEKENLDAGKGEELARVMAEKVFFGVKDYLAAEGAGKQERGVLRQDVRPEAGLVEPTEAGSEVRGKKEKPRETQARTEAGREGAPVVKGASFFFSPEDEEEIRELTKKINGDPKVVLTDEQIKEKLDKIIGSIQINFGSQQLSDRFQSILKTYLRGIRDRIEIKQTLKKAFAEGGLGFDDASADEVLKVADSVAGGKEIPARPPVKIKLPEDKILGKETAEKTAALKDIGMRDIDYSFSSLLAEKEREKKEPAKLDPGREIAPPPPAIAASQPEPEAIKEAESGQAKSEVLAKDSVAAPAPEFKKPAAKAPLRAPTPVQSSGKKRMEDVKYVPPKVMNPIDELRYMDLVNFRRLSPETGKQAAKVKEKINLLEEENYSRRTEGIKGWRQSPVNKLYLSIGQQSIGENKPIDVIIEERKKAGQDYLTLEEFKAIMDLNKELRF
ncbi:MAG: hypothetical protein PHQ42_01580 [Patescibacteria group bacterium]|nr:hypothetical protein [Patescibacteria group bacterium]